MGKQEFFRGQRVRLASKFPLEMCHFSGKGCEAIVIGSYSDQFGGAGYESFELLIMPMRTTSGKKYHTSAWYPSSLMTLISDVRSEGEAIIQEYNEWCSEHKEEPC